MNRTEILDNVTHKDLRVRTGYAPEFGDGINKCVVFPTEFAFVSREYPIVFGRDANGDLQSVALLGLDDGENLFLDNGRWNARYVPAIQQRGPFLIGVPKKADEDRGQKAMVKIDLDHPRVSHTEGEPLFLPHGGNSPFLEHASRILQVIYRGNDETRPMFDAFEEHGMIEPVELDISLDQSTKYKLPGFLTISQDKLAGLDGSSLEKLNKQGYLPLAMMVVASLGNVSWLIELKNRKRAAAAS
jgi:hypothetical protein